MKPQNYHNSITANISPGEAFEKINRVPDWWSKRFEGSAQKTGDAFTVRFGEIWKNFAVVELVPGKRIEWEVTDCHMPWLKDKAEWKNTNLIWEISAEKAATRIRFTHVGLIPEVECYEDCRKGWDYFIQQSLLPYLTKNQGLPEEE